VLGRDGGLPVSGASPRRADYDAAVTKPRRLAARPLLPMLAATIAAILAVGCAGPAATSSPTSRPSASRPAASSPPELTPVPGSGASPSARPAASRPPTTDVAGFGPILDGLPPSFPKLPGQQPAETGEGPSSGSFVVNGDVASASASIRSALQAKGWTVDTGAPLEDGTVVLEATGPAGCKAEIRFTPVNGSVMLSVLYGATCPYP
jgi:hypothetical protein